MTSRYARAAELHAAAFAGAERGWSEDEIRTLAERPGGLMIEKPDGFVLGQIVVDEAEILTIAVHPDRRNRGEGRALLAAFELAAANLGAGRVFLDVSENNNAARSLYSAAGYSEDGLRRRYYRNRKGERFDAIQMSKSIESPD